MGLVYFRISFRISFLPILIVACVVLISGCGEDQNAGENTSGDTGSIAISILWQGMRGNSDVSGVSSRALTGDACQDFEIAWVVAKVYNESGGILRGPIVWDCNLHAGSISKVKPGRVYVVIEAHVGDVDASPEWRGQSAIVLVRAGEQSDVAQVNLSNTSDDTPPTILSTNPETDATSVAINTPITVAFSEGMAESSIDNDSFVLRITGGVPVIGTVSYDAVSHIAIFIPNSDLVLNTSYTVTIMGESPLGVSDLAGKFLGADFSWSFTTAVTQDTTPPTVTDNAYAPTGTAVNETTAIQVAFSEPMDAASISAQTFVVNNGVSNIAGTITYQADNGTWVNVASFQPSVDLDFNTAYTVAILSGSQGVKDLAGNPLQADFTWNFTTRSDPQTGLIWDQSNWDEANWN